MKVLLLFFVILLFLNACSGAGESFIDKQNDVGVFKNYRPSDSILNFHKIHGSDLAIDCKKCHFENSKNEKDSSINKTICLSCHQKNEN